jgi:hypothetical protein
MTDKSRSTGGCACGAVCFVAEGEPWRVGLCHCLDCRKHQGAPFSAFAVFPADRVQLAGEAPGAHASSARVRRHFCRGCGSPLFVREEGSDEVVLFLGAFDEVGRFAPTYESWVPRREPWLPEIPGVVRRYGRDRTGPQRTEP